MADYRKEVKIQAIKAAKEKANYLLNAIGNKAGKPLEIIEISDNDSDEVVSMGYNKAKFSNYVSKSELTNNQIDNVESIKLRSVSYTHLDVYKRQLMKLLTVLV